MSNPMPPHDASQQPRKHLIQALLSAPDVLLFLLVAGVGVVAAAWILIGAGLAVGLLVALLAIGALWRKGVRKDDKKRRPTRAHQP